MYTVTQVAKMMNISEHTLRFYDKEGLFPNLYRDSLKRRYFQRDDLYWLSTIQFLKETGLPICEIREFVEMVRNEDASIEERSAFIRQQRERLAESFKVAKRHLRMLELKMQYCEALIRGETDFMPFSDVERAVRKLEEMLIAGKFKRKKMK